MTPDRIIVPLDVSSLAEAVSLLDRLPEVGFWKVGLELFVGTGAEILGLLKERQKKIFLDLKFHDIPNTVAGACRCAGKYGVDLLTIHSSAGRAALIAASSAIQNFPQPPRLLAITLLTSINPEELTEDLKISLELSSYVLKMAFLAQESGINGAVCSPHEVGLLRQRLGRDFLLVCPGVRPSWSEPSDQRRIMTPLEAFQAGADYLVLGRPITSAVNPQEAWQRICEELAHGERLGRD
jgi:orotidine-5'-phosphate decarboxylase